MPLSYLQNREFLKRLREEGLNIKNQELIINYESSFYKPIGLVTNDDLYFNFSPLYEEARAFFIILNSAEGKSTPKYKKINNFFMGLNKRIFKIESFILRLITD